MNSRIKLTEMVEREGNQIYDSSQKIDKMLEISKYENDRITRYLLTKMNFKLTSLMHVAAKYSSYSKMELIQLRKHDKSIDSYLSGLKSLRDVTLRQVANSMLKYDSEADKIYPSYEQFLGEIYEKHPQIYPYIKILMDNESLHKNIGRLKNMAFGNSKILYDMGNTEKPLEQSILNMKFADKYEHLLANMTARYVGAISSIYNKLEQVESEKKKQIKSAE